MIGRDEISAAASELDVSPTSIERDYLFGWMLSSLYQGRLGSALVLKGGKELERIVGVQPKAEIERRLQRVMA